MPVSTINVVDAGLVTRNVNALPGLGTAADDASLPVAQSTEGKAQTGSLTETAPATDTASSGLNGRLQRIAQRITSLIALIPASLGTKSAATSLAVALSTEDAATIGSLTETAPGTDTASSGLNGRLQRIAQRLTTLIGFTGTFGAITAGRAVLYDSSGAAIDQTATINVAQDTATVKNGATSLTPKFAAIAASSSGANTVVALVSSKKLRILGYVLTGNGAVNAKWVSHATTSTATGLIYIAAAGGGAAAPFNPVGWFETVAGEALDLNLSGATAVGGHLVYIEV